MKWSVSNIEIQNQKKIFSGKSFSVYSTGENTQLGNLEFKSEKYKYLFEGYCIARQHVEFSQTSEELLKTQFNSHGFNFIKRIKGAFNILIFDGNSFKIYTDHHAILKYFIYGKSSFIISNSLKVICLNSDCSINNEHIAIHGLFNHYINNITFIKDLEQNSPGSIVKYCDNRIYTDYYFQIDSLLAIKSREISYSYFADQFKSIIAKYLTALNTKDSSLTLTGGKDSRTILAALLANGSRPYTFTYGSPHSSDVHYARKIAESVNLEYSNYNPGKVSSDWFRELGNEIIESGQSLVNIHRAHRLEAIKKLSKKKSVLQPFFGGYMGGELMMGIYYDDLIITDFIKEWYKNEIPRKALIKKFLERKFFDLDKLDLTYIESFCKNLPFLNSDSSKTQEFYLQFQIAAHAHHLSDIYLYMNHINYPIPIFLDIDFLQLLFASNYNFLYQNNNTRNPLKRIKLFELNMNIQNILAPELSNLYFAKKGSYTTNEFLGNKLRLLVIRTIRIIKNNQSFSNNFSLDKWMFEFVSSDLKVVNNQEVHEIFNIDAAASQVNNGQYSNTESSWHKYTDIIMLDQLINKYLKQ